jgi:hypothetical protein
VRTADEEVEDTLRAAAVGVVNKGKDVKALGGGKAVQKSSPVGKGKVKATAKPAAKKKAACGDRGEFMCE